MIEKVRIFSWFVGDARAGQIKIIDDLILLNEVNILELGAILAPYFARNR